ETVRLSFFLTATEPPLDLSARVAWLRSDAQDVRGEPVIATGLAFDRPDATAQRRLEHALESHRATVLLVAPDANWLAANAAASPCSGRWPRRGPSWPRPRARSWPPIAATV